MNNKELIAELRRQLNEIKSEGYAKMYRHNTITVSANGPLGRVDIAWLDFSFTRKEMAESISDALANGCQEVVFSCALEGRDSFHEDWEHVSSAAVVIDLHALSIKAQSDNRVGGG